MAQCGMGSGCHGISLPWQHSVRSISGQALGSSTGSPPGCTKPTNLTLHVHVSGSGGTSICDLARRQKHEMASSATNCAAPLKGAEPYMAQFVISGRESMGKLAPMLGGCAGLHRLAVSSGAGGPFTFAEVETQASRWLDCPGVRYSFLMTEPVRRILTQAHMHCGAGADGMRKLRDWYEQPWVIAETRCGTFGGTAVIDNYNIRMLTNRDVFIAPLGTLNRSHLRAAKDRLTGFALVADLRNTSDHLFNRTLGWVGSLHRRDFGNNSLAKDLVHEALDSPTATPPDVVALVRRHNALDLELYEWVQRRQNELQYGPTSTSDAADTKLRAPAPCHATPHIPRLRNCRAAARAVALNAADGALGMVAEALHQCDNDRNCKNAAMTTASATYSNSTQQRGIPNRHVPCFS